LPRRRVRFFELQRLFPPNDPLANALFRLCVLREDLHLEMRVLCTEGIEALEHHDQYLWRIYFVRRVALSLAEADEILGLRLIDDFLRDPPPTVRRSDIAQAIQQRRQLRRCIKRIRLVRNRLVAHLDERHCAELLRTQRDFSGPIQIGERITDTVFRLPSHALTTALLPGTITAANFVSATLEFITRLHTAHLAAMSAIDHLMFAHIHATGGWS
jgi:hypothetical protein